MYKKEQQVKSFKYYCFDVPNNFISAFTNNGNVLAIVFLAVVTGLSMNALEDQTKTLKKLFEEVQKHFFILNIRYQQICTLCNLLFTYKNICNLWD